MKFAERISQVKPSTTMVMAAKAKEMMARGISVTDFGLGEPDFRSPDVASEAAILAIQQGKTKYTPPSGTSALKEAIVAKLKRDNGLVYSTKEVIVSCGAKHTLYNIAQVLFEKGDEVIVPAPYWVSYPDQILLNDATPVIVQTKEEERFLLSPEVLRKALTPRTKAVILNYPCNPTGATYSKSALEGLAEVLLGRAVWVVSDEIYEKFIYDGAEHTSIASLGVEMRQKTILVNGVSKAYSMTGWRIGYAAGPEAVIRAMDTVQSQSTSNPASISQEAARAALLHGETHTQKMVCEFEQRREMMVNRLNRIKGISCPKPAGAFYLFPNVMGLYCKRYKEHKIKSAADFASFLLEEEAVLVIPGEPFGGEGHIRLSYATPRDILSAGLDKIEKAVLKLSH